MKHISGLVTIAIFTLTAVTTSCRSTKTIQTAIAKKDTAVVIPIVDHRADSMVFIKNIIDTIHKNNIDFRTFSAKIKVDFDRSDGRKVDFTTYVKLKKDSVLWISINALIGL